MDQDSETSGQSPRSYAASELIICFADRESPAEKKYEKGEPQDPANDAAISERLQIVVVRLLQPVETVARVVPGIDHAERTQPASDYRICLNNVKRYAPKMCATRGRVICVGGAQQTGEYV